MKRCKIFVSSVFLCLGAAVVAYPQMPTPSIQVTTRTAPGGLLPASSVELRIFETPYVVNTYFVDKRKPDALKFVSLHHDEQTGLRIAKEVIARRGGRLFELVSTKNAQPVRYLYFTFRQNEYRIDPNRFFTSAGITKDLRKRSCGAIVSEGERAVSSCFWQRPLYEDLLIIVPEIQRFSEDLLKMIEPDGEGGALVSVHNNTDRGFSLTSYVHGGEEWQTSEKGIFYGKEDTDNFFLVTNEALFKKLVDHDPVSWDFNIVLQKQPPNLDDGSLSIYSGRMDWNYILVEAETYAGERQRQMIERVIETFEKQESLTIDR